MDSSQIERLWNRLPEPVRAAALLARDLRAAGARWNELPGQVLARFGESTPALESSLYRLGHAAAWTDEEAALRHIWGEQTGEEALAAALYGVIRCPDDVEAARRCVSRWGDHAEFAAALIYKLTA